ncbi:MAG: protein kinase [Anaerolineae bacterium]|nr:protein kinase [Anaerolineae bacterium]
MEQSSLIGSRLGKYEIRALVGRGGMGIVYEGWDPLLERKVAIKVLAPHLVWEQDFVERFLREARAAARIKHPNIVTIYDVGREGGWYYYVMEYLDGQSLVDMIRARGALSVHEVIAILHPLANALDSAHHSGLVHRDVKPANVIIDHNGRVTLTDFGIVRAAQETRLTLSGSVVGTPVYMSPEQIKGLAVDARSDQYSLGIVAYELLSGLVPFKADSTLALMYKVVHEPLTPIRNIRPDLPPGVEQVLAKVLAREPGDRYSSATAFVDDLAQFAEEQPIPTTGPVRAPQIPMAPKPVTDRLPGLITPDTAGPAAASLPIGAAPSNIVKPPVPAEWDPGARAAPALADVPGRRVIQLRRVPAWIWGVAALALLAIVVGVVWMGNGNRDTAVSQASAEASAPVVSLAASDSTASPAAPTTAAWTATPSPTPEAAVTLTFTPTPSRTPTRTPAPTPSRTRTPTPTFTPTATHTPTRVPSRPRGSTSTIAPPPPDRKWSAVRGGETTDTQVAAVTFGGTLYVFSKGISDKLIYVNSTADGANWAGAWPMAGGRTTDAAVSAAVFNNRLYLFSRDIADRRIYVASTANGASWSGWTLLSADAVTDAPLAVTTFQSRLYVFGKGIGNQRIYVNSTSTGSRWTGWVEVPGGGLTNSALAASTLADKLYLFTRGLDNRIYVNRTSDGSSWRGWLRMSGDRRTDAPLASAIFDSRVYVFAKEASGQEIYFNSRADTTDWAAWAEVPGGGLTNSALAAATLNDKLYLFARGVDNRVYLNRTGDGWK